MKRKKIIISLIVAALILFAIPFFFDNGTKENIVTGINLISGFASLLTLVIALLLFNKYGIETSLLEKQTKEVFELLEKLNNTIIFIQGSRVAMRFNPAKPYIKLYESYYNKKLVFSTKCLDGLHNLWKHCDNIFLPKEIADKLKSIQIYKISYQEEEIDGTELKVSVPYKNNKDELFGKANDIEITFMEFVSNWKDLIEKINKWISQHNSLKSELNL